MPFQALVFLPVLVVELLCISLLFGVWSISVKMEYICKHYRQNSVDLEEKLQVE